MQPSPFENHLTYFCKNATFFSIYISDFFQILSSSPFVLSPPSLLPFTFTPSAELLTCMLPSSLRPALPRSRTLRPRPSAHAPPPKQHPYIRACHDQPARLSTANIPSPGFSHPHSSHVPSPAPAALPGLSPPSRCLPDPDAAPPPAFLTGSVVTVTVVSVTVSLSPGPASAMARAEGRREETPFPRSASPRPEAACPTPTGGRDRPPSLPLLWASPPHPWGQPVQPTSGPPLPGVTPPGVRPALTAAAQARPSAPRGS